MTLLVLMLLLTLEGSRLQVIKTFGVQREVDIVLPCVFVLMEDRGAQGGAGGLSFARKEVTLLLRNLTVTGQEEELESITRYQPSEDKEMIIYQVTVRLEPLPFAERLLHADCDGEDVVCEISPISSAQFSSRMYMIHIHLPELSIAMVTRADTTNHPGMEDKTLQDGSMESLTVDLLVSSSPTSQLTPIAADVSLNCEVWGDQERAQVEWYLQKEGKGQRLDPEDGSRLSVNPGALAQRGDSSLAIRGVRVKDEGTYICAVTSGQHRVQQILQLQVREPPQVTVFLSLGTNPTLTCHTDRYYPLDVEVSWLLGESPVVHASPVTSSHRRNSDGTYNVSTHLSVPVPPRGAPPDIYTCTVTHVSVSEPIAATSSVPPAVEVTSGGLSLMVGSIVLVLFVSFMMFQQLRGRRKKKHVE
ncbi:tapasin-related protein [Discoglossus pictus]